jgi:CheY-like chemotaxis protein
MGHVRPPCDNDRMPVPVPPDAPPGTVAPSCSRQALVEVLHIDDNPGDLALVHMAFSECCPGVTCRDMAEPRAAMAYLAQCVGAGAPPPSIVVLDLNMHGIRGQEVLTFIRGESALRNVPVVILSSSSLASEAAECMRLGAVAVVTKPLTFEALVAVARRVFGLIP